MIVNKPSIFHKGGKIKFRSEKQRYTIRACDRRFAICTKPFNLQKTYFYVIVDLDKDVRGPDNHSCFGYETDEECSAALEALQSGEMEVSRRRDIKLDIERIC